MTCLVQITHARACWGTGRPLPASDGVPGPWHVRRAARGGLGRAHGAVKVERATPGHHGTLQGGGGDPPLHLSERGSRGRPAAGATAVEVVVMVQVRRHATRGGQVRWF